METSTKSTVSQFVRFSMVGAFFVVVFLVISATSTPTNAQAPNQATPAATQPETGAKEHAFVGQVQDSQAFIGFQVSDSQVRVFVCDGTKTSISYWHWFTGQFVNGSVEVTAPDGEKLSAQLADNVITGTVTLGDKKPHDFTATSASGTAGLIRTEFTIDGVDYVGGWVSLSDGQVRGGIADKKGKKKPLIVIIAILIG
jgi:hypothetical protein